MRMPIGSYGLHGTRRDWGSTKRRLDGPSHEGAGLYQVTAKDGFRVSATDAFLEPAHGRRDLEIQKS